MPRTTGREFILDGSTVGASAAMVDLYSHACDWMQTIDCLHYGDGLALADAVRVADAGFRGDNIRAARRVLAALDKAAPVVTLGERLTPGCTCGAASSGNFNRCTCD